ncbi:5-carboxymethyl-2-hydroxymuconate isomerase [Maritimibacter sp. UBA3975]|uniref:5-carboxymethyl-2-hydroxymuconate isomerase n=1 Tax=Maritimibacter sp. UBA3975 TaxID=1946833 RepID=UPI000C0A1DDB|nr:5-carboxymethyl-2-hydroxymuconate isomerase [Maritimibacter sp. UBA3975]MAM61357.1 5-carboxymethyl-2-hydroxymuconate isomerase [Maritimibacter sp.]|tara:strand:+ start:13572 stop:13967 length:396 start_codon:yes stop_codon:yes gene_type:complete
MAHLSMEYSGGLDARCDMAALARAAHGAMVDAGIFPVAGIRVRLHRADVAIVADGLDENDFLAMTLSVGAGRTTEALKAAGDAIFAAVQGALRGPLSTPHFALSLEIRVIDPELSWKDTPIHARLSGQKKD